MITFFVLVTTLPPTAEAANQPEPKRMTNTYKRGRFQTNGSDFKHLGAIFLQDENFCAIVLQL